MYFPFFVESFVIGFAIVEIPSVVISKKKKCKAIAGLIRNASDITIQLNDRGQLDLALLGTELPHKESVYNCIVISN